MSDSRPAARGSPTAQRDVLRNPCPAGTRLEPTVALCDGRRDAPTGAVAGSALGIPGRQILLPLLLTLPMSLRPVLQKPMWCVVVLAIAATVLMERHWRVRDMAPVRNGA